MRVGGTFKRIAHVQHAVVVDLFVTKLNTSVPPYKCALYQRRVRNRVIRVLVECKWRKSDYPTQTRGDLRWTFRRVGEVLE